MKYKTTLITLGLFILLGCKDAKPKNAETEIPKLKSIGFNVLLKKFNVLTLPLIIKPLEITEFESFNSLDRNEFKLINDKNFDFNSKKVYAYGILPDTIKSYKLIYLLSREPILVTFDKLGRKVNEENLSISGCKTKCGFLCSQKITISKDQSIYSGNFIKSHDCDSLHKTEKNQKKYYRFKVGNVNSNGKIYLSQVMVKSE